MPIYFVAVELDHVSRNDSSLRKKLVGLNALQAQGSVWLVRYDKGAEMLRDHLQNDLNHNDRLFVGAFGREWAAFNMAPSSRWLNEALSSRGL